MSSEEAHIKLSYKRLDMWGYPVLLFLDKWLSISNTKQSICRNWRNKFQLDSDSNECAFWISGKTLRKLLGSVRQGQKSMPSMIPRQQGSAENGAFPKLVWEKINRTPLRVMVKTRVSCRYSLGGGFCSPVAPMYFRRIVKSSATLTFQYISEMVF